MKKKVGYYLPAPLADAYEEVASRVGEREKSQVIGAAILMLLEASEGVKNDYINRVRLGGGPGNGYDKLVAEALARSAEATRVESRPPVKFDKLTDRVKKRKESGSESDPSAHAKGSTARSPKPPSAANGPPRDQTR